MNKVFIAQELLLDEVVYPFSVAMGQAMASTLTTKEDKEYFIGPFHRTVLQVLKYTDIFDLLKRGINLHSHWRTPPQTPAILAPYISKNAGAGGLFLTVMEYYALPTFQEFANEHILGESDEQNTARRRIIIRLMQKMISQILAEYEYRLAIH